MLRQILKVRIRIVYKTITPSQMQHHIGLAEVRIGIFNREDVSGHAMSRRIHMVTGEVCGDYLVSTLKQLINHTAP